MKKLFTFVLLLGMLPLASIGYFLLKKQAPAPEKEENEAAELLGPYDWFTHDRCYPDNVFPIQAYKHALEAAARGMGRYKDLPDGFDEKWSVQGPYNIGGRFNTLAADPVDTDVIYAGSAAGGLFKTENGGKSWKPIFDQFSWLAIGTLTIDPTDHNTLYVGTGDANIGGQPAIGNGLYRTTDGGKSWTHLGLDSQYIVSKVIVDPDSNNIIYAATMGLPFKRDNNRGLYKSTDYGKTWNQVLFINDDAGIIDLAMQPGNPLVLYAVAWSRIRNNHESISTSWRNGIYKSNDGGRNWKRLVYGLPSYNASRIGIAISPKDTSKMYAVYVQPGETLDGVYKSTNAGFNWNKLPTNGMTNNYGNYGWYFGKVYIDPVNDDKVYLPGVDLYKYNGAGRWVAAAPFWYTYEVHADKHDMQWLDSAHFIMATDGGIYKYSAPTNHWEDIENIPATQFYHAVADPFHKGIYVGGAQDNGTTAGKQADSARWLRVYGGDGFQPVYNPKDSSIMFAETQNGYIARYSQDGFGWQDFRTGLDLSDRFGWDMPYFYSRHSATLYTGTQRVYKTADGLTSSWEAISSDLTKGVTTSVSPYITTVCESPLAQGYLTAGTSDGKVWRSLDSGQWIDITTGLPNRYVTKVVPSPLDKNTIYVTHSGYKDNDFIPHIHKSTDLGDHWTDISGDLPQIGVNSLMVCPTDENILFAATDAGVYATTNGGSNWYRLGEDMPIIPVFDLSYDPALHRLVAATYARSIMTYPLNGIFAPLYSGIQKSTTKNIAISTYPNPFTEAITVHLPNAGAAPVSITLRDIQGRIILQKEDMPNREDLRLDVPGLPRGTYILSVTAGGQQSNLKVFRQ